MARLGALLWPAIGALALGCSGASGGNRPAASRPPGPQFQERPEPRGSQRSLVLASNEWWPYAGRAGAEREGFAVDLVRAALARIGYRLDYRTRPWARCVQEMRERKVDGVLAAYRVPGRNWLCGEVPLGLGPEGGVDFAVLKRRGSSWRFRGPESLGSAKLAVVEGYHYPEPIEGRMYRSKREGLVVVSGDDPTARILRAVASGRVDAVVENRAVLQAALAESPELRDRLEEAGSLPGRKAYVQLRPDLPGARELLRELDRALLDVYRSPEFPRILKRYGLRPTVASAP